MGYLFDTQTIPDNIQHTTNIHAPDGFRTHNPNMRAATDPRRIPRDRWYLGTEIQKQIEL